MFFGEYPYLRRGLIQGKRTTIQAKKGNGIMIRERTTTLTIYNAYCDHCGTQGPDGINEVDAHIVAVQAGWHILGDSYICNNPVHDEFKEMHEILVEMKQQHDSASDLSLLTWWR